MMTLPDGSVVKNVLSPDSHGVAAALHHEAILALMAQIDALTARVADLESKNLRSRNRVNAFYAEGGSRLADAMGHQWDILNRYSSLKFAIKANRLCCPTVKYGAPGRYLSNFKIAASRS
jgi:hypothetical protein